MLLRSEGSCPAVPLGFTLDQRLHYIQHSEYDSIRAQRRMLRTCHMEQMNRNVAASLIQKKFRLYFQRKRFGRRLKRMYACGEVVLHRLIDQRKRQYLDISQELNRVYHLLGHLHAHLVMLEFIPYDPNHFFARFIPLYIRLDTRCVRRTLNFSYP